MLNGILWTIAVELQFYLIIPILYFSLNNKLTNKSIILLILIFGSFNLIFSDMSTEYGESLIYKLIHVSFIPWFHMFLMGVLFQKNFKLYHLIFSNRAAPLFLVYVVAVLLGQNICRWGTVNNTHPLL